MESKAPELVNWDGGMVTHPQEIAYPRTVDEILNDSFAGFFGPAAVAQADLVWGGTG
jgi:hypothetical protein